LGGLHEQSYVGVHHLALLVAAKHARHVVGDHLKADTVLLACITCDTCKLYLQANNRTFVHFSLNLGLHTRESLLIVEVIRNAPDEVAAQAVA
jgi:hypothetical protein